MDEFRRQYRTYYILLCVTGLWPFDHSILANIQRTSIAIVILCCIIIQFSSLTMTELSLNNILMTLTAGGPILLFFFRYLGFIYSFSAMGFIYENIGTDCSALKNPFEVDIFRSHIDASRRVVLTFLLVCCYGIFLVAILLFFPSILNFLVAENNTQPHYLKAVGFFVDDRYATLISVHIMVTFTIGLLIITCTEGLLAVFAYYVCGLFKVTSCRIQQVIDNAGKEMAAVRSVSYHIGLREAVAIHERTINIIDTGVSGTTLAYLVAIILVVVSFGLNQYRFFLAIVNMNDPLEVAFAFSLVSVHMVIMFLNNHSGQIIIDDSVGVFNDTYNTLWYRTPVGLQKSLIIILQRSSIECACNLSGLFVPSYEGFATMMSSSFSYFTLLYSVQ